MAEWQEGQAVIVHTSLGWLRGVVHQLGPNGAVQVEIKKTRRGTREYLPSGAHRIWPYDWRFAVTIAAKDLDNAHIQPDPFTRTAASAEEVTR